MFSKTRLPKLIGLHRYSVRGEWVAQKICPSRIFAFADLSGPMLSENRHQARRGACGELTSATDRLGGAAGKRYQHVKMPVRASSKLRADRPEERAVNVS